MKRLALLRHAKSAWDDPVTRDIDRPLNARGRRAARAIGRAIRTEQLRFDEIIASPAVRVVETLEEVGLGYGATLRPRFDEELYLAVPETMLDLIHATDDAVTSLLLVGHNPGLERLAILLTGQDDGNMRALVQEKYPTGAFAEISLPVHHWSEAAKGMGSLVRFIRPRDLDPSLGPEE